MIPEGSFTDLRLELYLSQCFGRVSAKVAKGFDTTCCQREQTFSEVLGGFQQGSRMKWWPLKPSFCDLTQFLLLELIGKGSSTVILLGQLITTSMGI